MITLKPRYWSTVANRLNSIPWARGPRRSDRRPKRTYHSAYAAIRARSLIIDSNQ
jgi:hypothetical protein